MDLKPFFATCLVESVNYNNNTLENVPVNLALCKSINKGKYSWYPDNIGLPSIEFGGCDITWIYADESTRNSDFMRISNNKF